MVQENLVQYLPSVLDEAVQNGLKSGESVLISMPGALGEALVVTDRRIAIVREKGPREGVDMFAYSLSDVAGVQLGTSTAGGSLSVEGVSTVDEEQCTIYFASYDRSKFEPDNASYHCNLAVAYDEAGRDDDARHEYERTLELNPDDTTALLCLGYLLNEAKEYEQAANLWKRLIAAAPGTPEAEEAEQNLRVQEGL